MTWLQNYDPPDNVALSTAINWYGHEGKILRYVFLHSVALTGLVGILVSLQVYVFPFTEIMVK